MFEKIQKEVNLLEDYITQNSETKSKDDCFILLTHLLSECGEVANEIKGLEGKRVESVENYTKDELAKELIDVIFNTLRIARYYNIDLDNYFLPRFKKIRGKFNK